MGRKRKNNKEPKVHDDLKGLDLRINEFGEIVSNIDIDKVNTFLTKNVPDKKLMNRYDDEYQQEFKIEEGEEIDEMESLRGLVKGIPERDDNGEEDPANDIEEQIAKKEKKAKGESDAL